MGEPREPGEYARAFAQGAVGTGLLAIALVLVDAPPASAVAVVAFVGLVCLGVAFGLAAAAVVLYVGIGTGEELASIAQFAPGGDGGSRERTAAWTTPDGGPEGTDRGSGPGGEEHGRHADAAGDRGAAEGSAEETDETGGFVFQE